MQKNKQDGNQRVSPAGTAPAFLAFALSGFLVTGYPHTASAGDSYGPYLSFRTHTAEDAQVIQELIKNQLEAIRERDADLAYALTTGTFHKKFDTAGKFLNEMRFSYRPVYNHQSFRFLDQGQTETGELIQRVEVSYTHGGPTIVIYRLRRDDDGGWGIDSFTILESDEGQPI